MNALSKLPTPRTKSVIVQSPRNTECATMRLSGLDWTNWRLFPSQSGGLLVKAEDGENFHLVRSNVPDAQLGSRNGKLVWVVPS